MNSQDTACSTPQSEETNSVHPNNIHDVTAPASIGILNVEQESKEYTPMTTCNKGGWRTMPFIFANEVCEKLGAIGFGANLIMYLTQTLHMDYVQAANLLTNFGGTSSLTPLVGAFLADAYVGRFWVIVVGSIAYFLGTLLLTLSATIPSLEPVPCTHACKSPSHQELAIVIMGFLLTAIGSGGIRPCVAAFGADQLPDVSNGSTRDKDLPQENKHPLALNAWSFFNWYYFVTGVSSLLAVTVIVYIQDNVGWGFGFGVPSGLMFLSIISFLIGAPLYIHAAPMGSPLARLARVMVASIRKRHLSTTKYAGPLYELSDSESLPSQPTHLVHTEQFNFLDRAAMQVPGDQRDDGSVNPWRLCTVTEVEELKVLLRMGPIWAAGIILVTTAAQQSTFSVLQARTLNRHLFPGSSFQIPPGSITVFSFTTMLVTVSLYDRILMPLAARITGYARGLTSLQRIGVGFVVSTMASSVAAVVEVKRKQVAMAAGALDVGTQGAIPMSVYYLLPQYCLHGVAEAFMSIGHLEFFYNEAPETMRSTATALFWTCIAAGSYLSSFLVSIIHQYTEWLPKNLNRGHLEYFYSLLTFLQVMNLIFFYVSARWYKYKKIAHDDPK